MHLEVISDDDRLREFASEWSAFAASQPNISPFQLPEWLLPWCSHFGNGSLRVFVFREQECVGVMPCFLHEWNGKRQITLIGSGISDYLDPVFVASREPAILACLREQLSASNDWDVCDWQDLSFTTPLSEFASAQTEAPCREIPLTGDFEQFWQHRPRYLHRNVHRGVEHARRNGPLTFHVSGKGDCDLMNTLTRLHTAQWNAQGQPGMIEQNHSGEFIRHIARDFSQRDMLRIFSLTYREEIAAIILGFVYRGIVYNYLTGFDPAHKQLSLASVLLYKSIGECYRQGFRAWNFCRGDEPYKTEWGAEAIRRCRVVLHRNSS